MVTAASIPVQCFVDCCSSQCLPTLHLLKASPLFDDGQESSGDVVERSADESVDYAKYLACESPHFTCMGEGED